MFDVRQENRVFACPKFPQDVELLLAVLKARQHRPARLGGTCMVTVDATHDNKVYG